MTTTLEAETETLPERISCDVVIVGYGPVGMVLSGLLAGRGFRVVVVERHHALYPLARAGHYDGETMRVFQELGVADAVEIAAQPMLLWNLVTGDKEVLATMHIGEGGAGWKESYLSYQPEIERILDARARELGVQVLSGVAAEGIDQDADRARVTCRPVDEQDAAPTVVDAAYVIGADGANGFVGKALGIERADLGFAPTDALVLDFKLDDPDRELDLLPEVFQVLDTERPVLAGRWEGRNYMRFEFVLHEDEDPDEFAGEENCWELLKNWDLSPADGHIERAVVYRFEATIAPRWREGRVLLAGDAAHTMPPTMGQGLCSGIRDAANLAWKLQAVLKGDAVQELLDTVQSERTPHVRSLIDMSIGVGEIWNTRDAQVAHRRDEMLRMGNIPPAPKFPRLGPGVVTDEKEGSPSVEGRPSPQARVARGGRVDRLDEFGSGWKIVSRHADRDGLFTDRQRAALDELGVEFAHVSRGPGPDYYIDLDGEYDLWFRKHGLRAFVQRPDKYVFGAVATVDELPALVDRLVESLSGAGWTFHAPSIAVSADGEDVGLDAGAVARLPYPGPVDVRFASEEVAELFTSFFAAKSRHRIEETHSYFQPDRTYYADATLGWLVPSNAELYGTWKQYMPFWREQAKSYPVQVIGDAKGVAVVMTDTPELFGGEIRAIAIIDLDDDGKIVRWIDYWDGRGFGTNAVAQMRGPGYADDDKLGVDTVEPRQAPALGVAVEALMSAVGSGDAARLDGLLAFDATLEDYALRTTIRGRAAVGRYLKRASGRLPYQGASVRHVVGSEQGGGFEWAGGPTAVPRGAATITLDDEGKIGSVAFCWDGSLVEDDVIGPLVALAVEPRR